MADPTQQGGCVLCGSKHHKPSGSEVPWVRAIGSIEALDEVAVAIWGACVDLDRDKAVALADVAIQQVRTMIQREECACADA